MNSTHEIDAIIAEMEAPVEEIKDDVLENPNENIPTYAVGDAVKLAPNAVFTSGAVIPQSILNSKLYIRQVLANGNYSIGIKTTGRIAGMVSGQYLMNFENAQQQVFLADAYAALVKANKVDVKSRPDARGNTLKTLKLNAMIIVVEEKNEWAHLQHGGWIPVQYLKKIGN